MGKRRVSGRDKNGRPLPRCKGCGNVSISDGKTRKDYLNKDGYHTACVGKTPEQSEPKSPFREFGFNDRRAPKKPQGGEPGLTSL
jgi:arylsulfatase A-like enzyme